MTLDFTICKILLKMHSSKLDAYQIDKQQHKMLSCSRATFKSIEILCCNVKHKRDEAATATDMG